MDTKSIAEHSTLFGRDAASGDKVPAHHVNPVVAFIIGLAIILLASILNAAGLNLTKLDHVSHVCSLFTLIYLKRCSILGAHKCDTKSLKTKRLFETFMAAGNGAIHVRDFLY